ncbi:MAG: RNA polymerase sigma factor [Dethiobacteria bacterium]
MEDQVIIELYWKRDEAAIQETDLKYGRFCHSLALNILAQQEEAEECVSDTYHRAWNAIPPERPLALRAWLGKIVRNVAINRWYYHRAQKRYQPMEEIFSELADCVPEPQTTESIVEARELTDYIDKWLDTLPKRDRVLFVRRYWNGEALQKLATSCSTSPNKLAGRMYRLRENLRTYLTEKGVAL